MASIDELKEKSYGYITKNKYKVFVDNEFIQTATNVSIPNIVVNFNESSNYFMGKTSKMPNELGFSECSITFLSRVENGKAVDVKFFQEWVYSSSNSSIFKETEYNVTVNYQDDYTKNIIIQHLSENDDILYQWELTNTYPISINYTDLSYSSNNELMEITITFYSERIINSLVS